MIANGKKQSNHSENTLLCQWLNQPAFSPDSHGAKMPNSALNRALFPGKKAKIMI